VAAAGKKAGLAETIGDFFGKETMERGGGVVVVVVLVGVLVFVSVSVFATGAPCRIGGARGSSRSDGSSRSSRSSRGSRSSRSSGGKGGALALLELPLLLVGDCFSGEAE